MHKPRIVHSRCLEFCQNLSLLLRCTLPTYLDIILYKLNLPLGLILLYIFIYWKIEMKLTTYGCVELFPYKNHEQHLFCSSGDVHAHRIRAFEFMYERE